MVLGAVGLGVATAVYAGSASASSTAVLVLMGLAVSLGAGALAGWMVRRHQVRWWVLDARSAMAPGSAGDGEAGVIKWSKLPSAPVGHRWAWQWEPRPRHPRLRRARLDVVAAGSVRRGRSGEWAWPVAAIGEPIVVDHRRDWELGELTHQAVMDAARVVLACRGWTQAQHRKAADWDAARAREQAAIRDRGVLVQAALAEAGIRWPGCDEGGSAGGGPVGRERTTAGHGPAFETTTREEIHDV